MNNRRTLPYLVAVIILAWTLGTLARSGKGSGGILINSFWLVYLLYLFPVIVLGASFVLIAYLAWNWKLFGNMLGLGMAARRAQKKKGFRFRLIVWSGFWLLAIMVLYWKCGGLFCNSSNSTKTLTSNVEAQVGGSAQIPTLPVIRIATAELSNFIGSESFAVAFLGLVFVTSAIVARSVWVSMHETGNWMAPVVTVQEHGVDAVNEAIKALEEKAETNPKTRIILCYQRMIKSAAALGAPISPDLTARELEAGIRKMFVLKGPEIARLTQLFEEARYSLHVMTEADADEAHWLLVEMGQELKMGISVYC